MAKPVNFKESDGVKTSYNDSLFGKLWGDRKKIIEGYPKSGAGLVLPDIVSKQGGATYSYKVGETVDKVTCESGSTSFRARYKKDAKKWDVMGKEEIPAPYGKWVASWKCAEKGSGNVWGSGMLFVPAGPLPVVGGKAQFHKKLNFSTGMLKFSGLWDAYDVNGLKVAFDCKMQAPAKVHKANVGLTFGWPVGGVGVSGLSYNYAGTLTCNHHLKIDSSLALFGEVAVKPAGKISDAKGCAGVVYTLPASGDSKKTKEIRVRVNSDAQVGVGYKESLGKFSVSLGCVVAPEDVVAMATKGTPMPLPAFGFKIAC